LHALVIAALLVAGGCASGHERISMRSRETQKAVNAAKITLTQAGNDFTSWSQWWWSSGSDLADVFIGQPSMGFHGRRFGSPVLKDQQYSFFVQDDWLIRPGLTLNLGLRYEFVQFPREINNEWVNWNFKKMNMDFAGKDIPERILPPVTGWAPRIGVTYDPSATAGPRSTGTSAASTPSIRTTSRRAVSRRSPPPTSPTTSTPPNRSKRCRRAAWQLRPSPAVGERADEGGVLLKVDYQLEVLIQRRERLLNGRASFAQVFVEALRNPVRRRFQRSHLAFEDQVFTAIQAHPGIAAQFALADLAAGDLANLRYRENSQHLGAPDDFLRQHWFQHTLEGLAHVIYQVINHIIVTDVYTVRIS
jgi:hypothetical protein